MKPVRLMLAAFLVALAGTSSAYAHDNFSFGINIGGPGYYAPPPVRYYPAPPAVYYAPPPAVYYAPVPRAYYAPPPVPRAQFRYYNEGHRHGQWQGRQHFDHGRR